MRALVNRDTLARWAAIVAMLLAALSFSMPAAASRLPRLPGSRGCVLDPVVRPSTILLSCADGNAYLGKLTWSNWGAMTATGSGAFYLNSCKPYCAAAKITRRTAVNVVASAPAVVAGQLVFTRLAVTYSVDHVTVKVRWRGSRLGAWTGTPNSWPASIR